MMQRIGKVIVVGEEEEGGEYFGMSNQVFF